MSNKGTNIERTKYATGTVSRRTRRRLGLAASAQAEILAADPDPAPRRVTSYADRIQHPAPIVCASPPAQPNQHPPHPYAERVCVIRRARNGQGEELPYGHCVLDYNREFDYNVGDSLSTVFGIGSMLMSSSGVQVMGANCGPAIADAWPALASLLPRSRSSPDLSCLHASSP
jgi:hypothetical protein